VETPKKTAVPKINQNTTKLNTKIGSFGGGIDDCDELIR
jgi:hypothetical protein